MVAFNDGLYVSVIVSVYDDVNALDIILDALEQQTYQNFEIIVSEDGRNQEIAKLLKKRSSQKILHSCHDDLGWRKNKILNQSVSLAKGDLLVFIDGDCIPHRRFVEAHCQLAKPKTVYSGRRSNVKAPLVDQIRLKSLSINALTSWRFIFLNFKKYFSCIDNISNAIYINPLSYFRFLLSNKMNRRILGSNFSCFKEDLLSINGFDEDYGFPAFGEDTDLEWRFDLVGVARRSARNVAIQFHLDHPIRYDKVDEKEQFMNDKKKIGHYFCLDGIVKNG
jgi:cellulose synthase/poly-beta-1,6-N-acetylglucosamine synthase-like glycosyltransferase